MPLQPFLHQTIVLLAAPTQAVLHRDGTIRDGAEGVYHLDTRVLSALSLLTRRRLDFVGVDDEHANRATFRYVLRDAGEPTADAIVTVTRTVTVSPGRYRDTTVLHNYGAVPATVDLQLHGSPATARMDDVKGGRVGPVDGGPLDAAAPVEIDGARVLLTVLGNDGEDLTLVPGGEHRIALDLQVVADAAPLFTAVSDAAALLPMVSLTPDSPLAATLRRSIEDLRGLALADLPPGRCFIAAGAPWYFTLFGRDSLWTARFLLALGTDLALGTLRALADRQADHTDPASGAEPGKILHEMRADPTDLGGGVVLPPTYYGSIDATSLWLLLLHETWQYGAADADIRHLLPAARAALSWLERAAAQDPAGFIRYIDATGTGLANQGWKDSADGIRNHDGSWAVAPIALCEVQAYAVQAARAGADLLAALGDAGDDPAHWRVWAAALTARFRAAFWTSDETGPYPASAIDGNGRPVTSVTSNIGHLLGTGILTAEEAALVARRLMSPDLFTGYGLRTMATTVPGYNPFGYHTGSVWTHDTVIAARGLAAEGFRDEALRLVDGILDAATAFDHRLPELFAGFPRTASGRPMPYPASCLPQAWAAAAPIEALRLLLGLRPGVRAGSPVVAQTTPELTVGTRIAGLRLAGREIGIAIDSDHAVVLDI